MDNTELHRKLTIATKHLEFYMDLYDTQEVAYERMRKERRYLTDRLDNLKEAVECVKSNPEEYRKICKRALDRDKELEEETPSCLNNEPAASRENMVKLKKDLIQLLDKLITIQEEQKEWVKFSEQVQKFMDENKEVMQDLSKNTAL